MRLHVMKGDPIVELLLKTNHKYFFVYIFPAIQSSLIISLHFLRFIRGINFYQLWKTFYRTKINQLVIYFLCFLSGVVGVTTWRVGCQKSKVSQMTIISDEVFACLLMEIFCNNWSKLDLHAYKNGVIFDEETSTKKGKEH